MISGFAHPIPERVGLDEAASAEPIQEIDPSSLWCVKYIQRREVREVRSMRGEAADTVAWPPVLSNPQDGCESYLPGR